MTRRNTVSLITTVILTVSGVIMVASFIALLLVPGRTVREVLFFVLLGSAIVTIITYIFVSWADRVRIRAETQAENGLLRRTIAVHEATNTYLEEELRQMRKVLFGHVLSCSAYVEGDFDDALKGLLADDMAEDRDG